MFRPPRASVLVESRSQRQTPDHGGPTRMRLGLKLFLATVLAAVLVVPAAGAKPGNGNGGGNGGGGKPAWAGGGGNGAAKASKPAKAKGKPAWAGQGQAKKAEKAQRKLERRAAAPEADDPAEGEEQEGPLKDNPAFTCKFERDMMGDEAFAEAYGTNENKANAFGKCVSQEAHERDGVEGDDEEPTEEPAEAPAACEPADDEEPV